MRECVRVGQCVCVCVCISDLEQQWLSFTHSSDNQFQAIYD